MVLYIPTRPDPPGTSRRTLRPTTLFSFLPLDQTSDFFNCLPPVTRSSFHQPPGWWQSEFSNKLSYFVLFTNINTGDHYPFDNNFLSFLYPFSSVIFSPHFSFYLFLKYLLEAWASPDVYSLVSAFKNLKGYIPPSFLQHVFHSLAKHYYSPLFPGITFPCLCPSFGSSIITYVVILLTFHS